MNLFEYQSQPVNTPDLTELQLKRLYALSAGGRNVIDIVGNRVKATSFVGIVKLPNLTIQILPKLYRGPEDPQEAMRNLLHLLQYTRKLSRQIKETELSELLKRKTSFFEVLIYLFASHLWELLKRGIHRSYVTVEEESMYLKGSWGISQQLAQKSYVLNSFFIRYDDFTEDNQLNRIFKYAARLLYNLSTDDQNKRFLNEIVFTLSVVEDVRRVSIADLDQISFSRLNDEYKPIFELAKLFLSNLSLQLFTARTETYSFVIDMNILFEEFIAEFIKQEGVLSNTALSKCHVRTQKEGGVLHLAMRKEGTRVFELVPDIRIYEGNHTVCIIDTKYKLLRQEKINIGVSQADMYQMFAYAERYHCQRVILLYPEHNSFSKTQETDYWIDQEKRIEIRAIDIRRDISQKSEKQILINEFRDMIRNKKEELQWP